MVRIRIAHVLFQSFFTSMKYHQAIHVPHLIRRSATGPATKLQAMPARGGTKEVCAA